ERNHFNAIGHGGILLGQDTDYEWFDHSVNPSLYENIDGVVRNNFVTNTQGAGIGIYAALRAKVYNNTLVNVAQSMQGGIVIAAIDHYLPPNYDVANTRASTDATIMNNIVSVSGAGPVIDIREGGLNGSLNINHNRYYSTSGAA